MLHSTDAATVFLSVQARTTDVLPADIERELYDERTLVRMLGMRRTLFVVPRDLVPVVQAACTNTIEARQRRSNFCFRLWLTISGTKPETSPPKPAIWRTSVAVIGRTRGEAGRNTVWTSGAMVWFIAAICIS